MGDLRKCLKWSDVEVPKFEAKQRENAKRYKSYGSSSFNPESRDASFYLNVDAGDDEGDEVQEVERRPMGRDKVKAKKKGARSSGSTTTMNEEALARLMISEYASHNERALAMKKEERAAFLEIRKREVEIRK